jgi:hypothetical protein
VPPGRTPAVRTRSVLLHTPAGRLAATAAGVVAVTVAVLVVALWPDGGAERRGPLPAAVNIEQAEVVAVSAGSCESFAGPGCRLATIRLLSGARAGARSSVTLPADEFGPRPSPGDRIRVARNRPGGIDPALAERLPIDDPAQQPFAFIDFEGVAQEIVATLVGSTGLVAAVPLTTALAALLASRLPAESVPADEHAHVH